MRRQEKLEGFIEQFMKMLPEDLRRYREDLERNARAALGAAFNRMDLVTREEFDVQAELLQRTRTLADELERKIAELEKRLEGGSKSD